MEWWLKYCGLWTMMTIISLVQAEDPYRFFDWRVTYGNIYPLGIPQRVHFLLRSTIMSINVAFLLLFCFDQCLICTRTHAGNSYKWTISWTGDLLCHQ